MSCVLPEQIKALKADVKKNGGAKFLREMTSQERIDYLAKFTDYQSGDKIENRENAEVLNRQIEKQMLQPAQTAAIEEWLRGLKDNKSLNTVGRKKAILEMIKDREDILNPKKDKFFMGALVKQALGFEASLEDIRTLSDRAATVEEQKKKLYKIVPDYENMTASDARNTAWSTDEGRQAWFEMGEALLNFKEQYDLMNIKSQEGDENAKNTATQRVKKFYNELRQGDVKNAVKTVGKALWDGIKEIPGTAKASVASVDISATFRQLRGLWLTHPSLAAKASWQGIKAFGRELWTGEGKKLGMMELMMRPNALNGNYENFGLNIGVAEEAFPDNFYEKVKEKTQLGKVARLVTGSDAAYSMASQIGRAEFFDMMYEQSKDPKTGQPNLALLKTQKVGEVANQITGRANVSNVLAPKAEKAVNLMMFSPRYFMGRIRMLSDAFIFGKHYKSDTPYGNLARASVNNYIFVGAMAALYAMLKGWASGDDDETPEEIWTKMFDPRSAQFLQAKFGNARIDITGGEAGFIRTLARGISGKVMTGEGQLKKQKSAETFGRFLGGKMSPAFRAGQDVLKLMIEDDPKNYNYEPISAKSIIVDTFTPITLRNVAEAAQSNDWAAWVAMGADFIGLSSQYWMPSEKNEGKSAGLVREQERLAFKTNKAVGALKLRANSALNTKLTGATRDRANREFEQEMSSRLDRLIASPKYKKMSDAEKNKAMTKERNTVQKEIKKKYGIK